MREIKFRAWDNVNYMSTPFTFMEIQSGIIGFTSEAIIMQYTGLKDKNGKEIFEGDIINAKWKDGQHIGIEKCPNIIPNGFHFYEEMDDIDCEVIGNIYENHELLTLNK